MRNFLNPEKMSGNIFNKERENTMRMFSKEINGNSDLKEYVKNYLNKVQVSRNVDFEDVILITREICNNILRRAILSSDLTAEGIAKAITEVGARNIEIGTYGIGEYEINCEMEYIPNDNCVLSLPFFEYITICVSSDKSIEFSYGASSFTITRDFREEKWDTDVLYNIYASHPENFDINLFFNSFTTDDEEPKSSATKNDAEMVDELNAKSERDLREKVENWVRGLSAIPQQLITKAYFRNDCDELREITPPQSGDTIYHFGENESGHIVERTEEGNFIVELDNGSRIECAEDEIEVERFYTLPIWGTMWTFTNWSGNDWLTKPENLQKMAECGFRIYESEDGIFFGINGCGYDFYEYHWIPFYKAYVLGE